MTTQLLAAAIGGAAFGVAGLLFSVNRLTLARVVVLGGALAAAALYDFLAARLPELLTEWHQRRRALRAATDLDPAMAKETE